MSAIQKIPNNFELQILSDIHLELRKKHFNFASSAKNLALLGDIGNPFSPHYQEFLFQCADRFEKVFIVAGNHEFYRNEYFETCQKIDQICLARSNLYFLNGRALHFPGLKILGCTLWSHIAETHKKEIFQRLNDFKLIRYFNKKMSLENYEELHQKDLSFLRTHLALSPLDKKSSDKTIVLTHHAPIDHTGNPSYFGSSLSSAFVNTFSDDIFKNVSLWGFGHTHWQIDFQHLLHRTRFLSHQIGYEHESIPLCDTENLFVLK